jgi:hypothetical protein
MNRWNATNASASLRAAYKNGAAKTFMPWTYVPGSEVPISDPSVVKVRARALDFIAGVELCNSGLPWAFAVWVTTFPDFARISARASFASCSFHATALRSLMRLASLTRRRNRGSVANVRKVSFRILEYAGDAPRWMRAR